MTGMRDDPEPAVRMPHSWRPVDLAAVAAAPPEPPTIAGLVYPGRVHVWSGEPESLKSLTAAAVSVDLARAGATVVYIDLENGPRETYARLRALGLTPDELRQIIYLAPTEPLTRGSVSADVQALLADRQPSLVIVDGYTGSLALHGCHPNESAEIERHHRTVIGPLRSSGAAIVILDHLVKNRDNRGKFTIGSERKIGVADVHLTFAVKLALHRGGNGLVHLDVHKDRPGYLHRPRAAEIRYTSSATGEEITYTIEPASHNPAAATHFRPTILMGRVLDRLEHEPDPIPRSVLESSVAGKTDTVRLAIDTLVIEGHIDEQSGPRGARLYSLPAGRPRPDLAPPTSPPGGATSPLAAPHEQAESATSPHLAPTSPHENGATSPRRPSPSRGGDVRGELDQDELDRLLEEHADIAARGAS